MVADENLRFDCGRGAKSATPSAQRGKLKGKT